MPRLLLEAPQPVAPMPRTNPNAYGAQIGAEMDQTGRTVLGLGQVIDQFQESESRVAAVRYEQALQDEANRLSLQEPNIEERAKQFGQAKQRLLDQFKPKWGKASTYDERAGLAAMDITGRFEHATMVDAIKQSRANNGIELDHWATKAANSATEDEAVSYLAQAKETLESGNLYYSTAEKTIAEQQTFASAIDLSASKNPALSESLLNRFGNVLPPEAQAKLRGTISTESTYVEAQRVSDEALATLGPGASITDLTRRVAEKSSGKVREQAESRVRVAYNDRRAAEIEAKQNIVDGAWDAIYSGAGLDAVPRGLEHQDEGPMRSYIEARSKAQAAGQAFKPTTNPDVYVPLLQLSEDDPAAFGKVNLPEHRLELSDEHYNQLDRKQQAIRKPSTVATTSPSGASPIEIAKKVAAEAGIKGKAWNPYALRAIGAIEAMQAAQPDKPLTFEQKRAAAVGQLDQVPVPDSGWFYFDGNKRVGELTAKDRKRISEAPPADLIIRAQKALGPGADDALVKDWIDEWLTLQGVPTDGN